MPIRKYIEHSLYALAIQFAFILILDSLSGFIAATFFFVGRELAQAEYRYIKLYNNGRRGTTMRWWKVFTPEIWNVPSLVWDLLLPVIITATITFFI